MDQLELREQVIREYLTTGLSFRRLGAKYGLNFQSIHRWVMQYEGRMKKPTKTKVVNPHTDLAEQALPTDVKELQAELRKARLLNEVLTEVINIAEEELGLPIRKKSGTK